MLPSVAQHLYFLRKRSDCIKRMDEEDLSYYGTIGALALISLSFYWLHKNDQETRQLSAEDIRAQKLAVIIVNSGHNSSSRVKPMLEFKGFAIYEINFNGEQQISIDGTGIRINLESSKHIDEAVKFIKTRLESNTQKLHAYLSLPIVFDCDANSNSPKQSLEKHLYLRFCLLKSMLNAIGECEVRVIHIQDAISPDHNLSGLIHSVDSSISKFLCEQRRQVGENFIEVKVRESDTGSLLDALAILLEWASNRIQRMSRVVQVQFELEGSFVDCLIPGAYLAPSNTKDPGNSDDCCRSDRPDTSKREQTDQKIMQIAGRLVTQVYLGNTSLVI